MQANPIVELNEQNFRETLESSMQKPVLIHFWAPSQPESTPIIPELQTLAQQYNGAFTLALLNCEQQQAIAGQFGVQVLPTIALFINGQAADGMGGQQTIANVQAMLNKHLPSQEELMLSQALQLIKQQQFAEALTHLTPLADELKSKGEVKLALAECYLETQQFDLAKAYLESIPLEYQDNYFKGLVAKLELHEQAANSPEIQLLEQQWQQSHDPQHACDLALQYHQVNRDEEALNLLWPLLCRDLNCLDGEVKKCFMDILAALGQGNSLASQFRKRLYSLLY